MQQILIATDFSPRSDRALRRAALLARQTGAGITLVHVIHADQAPSALAEERAEAERLLAELTRTLRDIDGISAAFRVEPGVPHQGVARAADAVQADLVVVGAPRAHALRQALRGTTVEKITRAARRPLLMAGGVPSGGYRQLLVATDLSEGSGEALRAVMELGLDRIAAVTVGYVVDAALPNLSSRDGALREQAQAWVATERARAESVLDEFLRRFDLVVSNRVVQPNARTTAHTLLDIAATAAADVIVVGTRGRSGLQGRLLGSLALELLRSSPLDVIVVPAPGSSGGG